MRTMFSKSPTPSRATTPSSSPLRHTFSESLMEENVLIAQSVISKWDIHASSHASSLACTIDSLFSPDNRLEANQFLKSVNDLQSAMHYFVSNNSNSEKLVQAQNLMQTAMKRLEKEFHQILKANREYLDPESVSTHSSATLSSRASRASLSDMEDDSEDEFRTPDDLVSGMERSSMVTMADLKAIADCMISSGYAKECFKIYKLIRKSVVDETIYNLGVERLSFSLIQKMDWEALEIKIKNWLHAVKAAVKTLFYGERILCDHVFSASDSIRESCFSEICNEGAMTLFGFPENVAKCKKTPEKMFRTLDLYEAVSDLWPEIESIFAFESTSDVRSQAVNSLIRLGDAVRTMLTDLESMIQKDSSKTPVPGGGVHPLTRYVMNYMTFLTDYSGSLADIIADWPLATQSPLPETYFGSPHKDDEISSPVSMRIAWLILVLLCKLDGRAELYKDVALSYLFLANNLQYIVVKVRTSNLRLLLGEDWVAKHDTKVKQYAANYERVGWTKVLASLPEKPTTEIPTEEVRNVFQRFNLSFEDAYKKQSSWVVPDPKLRDEIKVSLARRIVPLYSEFYELNRNSVAGNPVRFAPDDLGNYLSDLFYGPAGGSVSGSVATNSTPSHSSRSSDDGRSR